MGYCLQQLVPLRLKMNDNCDIPQKQNTDGAIRLIAAWSHLYGHAKTVAGWQFLLSVAAALAMSMIGLKWPEGKLVTTPLSLVFGWIDILLLDSIQSARKRIGARTQELFDCEVFGLPWNAVRCSPKPETEILHEAAEEQMRIADLTKYQDWYPVEVGRLPLPLARLICQRAAVWWDMSQRREYARWLVAIVAILVIGIVGVSFTADHRVRDMILSVYLPIAPAVVWAYREYRRQAEAAAGLQRVKESIEAFYAEAIQGRHDFNSLTSFSRNVQDMIFDGRSRNPLLFNSIYKLLRNKHEIRMNEKAKEMVEDALARAASWKR